MSASLQTLSRNLRSPAAAQALNRGLNQTRRLSTTNADVSDARDGAVRDSIMDKIWNKGANLTSSPKASPVTPISPVTNTIKTQTATFTGRDPPLGTFAFNPSAAPRWSGSQDM